MNKFKVWTLGGLMAVAGVVAVAVVLLDSASAAAQIGGMQPKVIEPIKWEYKIIEDKQHTGSGNILKKLNEVGESGWDCVGTLTRNYYVGNTMVSDVEILMKRPKQ